MQYPRQYSPLGQDPLEARQLSDEQFFHHLPHYKPACYKGEGTPFLLINEKWYYSLPCIFIFNGLFGGTLVFWVRGIGAGPDVMADRESGIAINLALVSLVNLTYALTQFMNPGVRNLSTVEEEQYQQEGKYFCSLCRGYRTGCMEHCRECGVCVEGLDHHCGFFNKCISGKQKFAFYGFLVSVFGGFISVLVTLSANSGI